MGKEPEMERKRNRERANPLKKEMAHTEAAPYRYHEHTARSNSNHGAASSSTD